MIIVALWSKLINSRCNFNGALQNFPKLSKLKSIFYENNISSLWLIQSKPLCMLISFSLVYICLSYNSKTHCFWINAFELTFKRQIYYFHFAAFKRKIWSLTLFYIYVLCFQLFGLMHYTFLRYMKIVLMSRIPMVSTNKYLFYTLHQGIISIVEINLFN